MGFVSRALNSQDATFKIQCLKTYYNFLKEETVRNPYLKLEGFLDKIELLKKNKLGLKLNKIVHGVNGVNLMTVHGSKGLQFDYVFVIGCTENNWEKDKNSLPFRLNTLLPGEPKEALKEESRRLFYVALTRARKHLEISFSLKNDNEKPLMRSLFVEEVLESKVCELTKAHAPEEDLLHFFDYMLKPNESKIAKLFEREIVELYGDEFGKKPIGTGPFMFANWANGIKLNMIRNPNYFESTQQNSIPKLDGISISFIQSKQTELLEFIQGNLDLFTGLESSFKDEILKNDGTLNAKYLEDFEIQISPFLNTEYLAFNMEDESSPIHDLNYRKAIHHCINREAIINYLRNGIGTPANGGFIPIGLTGHINYDNSSFDIDLARKYIQKSNANKNQPITLTTTSNYLYLCILVQKNCAEIGIEVKIDVVPSSLLKQQKSAGDLTFFRSSWIADYPDGENFMACFYGPNKAPSGPNYSRYINAQFDQQYNQLIACTDESEKEKLFKKMESMLDKDQPFILLFYDESIWIKNKKINQVNINALNHLDLRFTDFKS